MNKEELIEKLTQYAIENGMSVLGAILILFIGFCRCGTARTADRFSGATPEDCKSMC